MSKLESGRLRVVHGRGPAGDVFSVLLKRSFVLGDGNVLVRADADEPLREIDSYWDDGDPLSSVIEHESELCAFKPLTDVVVVGRAYAPDGPAVRQIDVGIEVAGHRKALRVIGDRRCVFREGRDPEFTDPEPFVSMPLRIDRAYGGVDAKSVPGVELHYPRNPMGRGVVVANRRDVVDGLALPNIEDATDLLVPERVVIGDVGRWNAQPLPQGLGWFPRTCYPRCSFVGAMPPFVRSDTVMREEALGLVPAGQIGLAMRCKLPAFDLRFNNGAFPGLQFPALSGGERIRLANVTPGGGIVSFALPDDRPRLALDTGAGAQSLDVAVHTVSIEPDRRRVDIVWRGAFAYPGPAWLSRLARLDAEVDA